jgi:hypothetical protein
MLTSRPRGLAKINLCEIFFWPQQENVKFIRCSHVAHLVANLATLTRNQGARFNCRVASALAITFPSLAYVLVSAKTAGWHATQQCFGAPWASRPFVRGQDCGQPHKILA